MGFHRELVVPDDAFDGLVREAETKDAVSDRVGWTRRWNPQFNLVGLIGEWTYATVMGLEREQRFGDGGRDFGDVDVKASSRYASPLLLRLASDPLAAPLFALVAVDVAGRRARYVGFATREELRRAPLREYGYGPTRTLRPDDLHRGAPTLCPALTLSS